MRNALSPLIFRLWLVSAVCILAIVLGFGFVFPDAHLPAWLELAQKGTAVLAFLISVLVPVMYAVARPRPKQQPHVLAAATVVVAAGYALLLGVLVYVKLRTCDANVAPYDGRWHCTIEGKAIVIYVVLIPVFGIITGILYGCFERLSRRRRNGHE